MTYFEQELQKIKATVYSNQDQIDKVIEMRNYIEHHYASDLNLEQLSNAHFVSKYHLLRMFKKYYGLTPKQYLIDIRIKRAKEKLKNGMTVTETCFAVGFESVGSFSALFKRKVNMSPAQFQKEQLSRSDL